MFTFASITSTVILISNTFISGIVPSPVCMAPETQGPSSFTPARVSVVVASGPAPSVEKDDIQFRPDMVWPVENAQQHVSSGYGWRTPSCSRCSSNHKGVDFTPGRGKPIFASLAGTVVQAQRSGEYGVHVVIEHVLETGDVWYTTYAHMQDNSIPPTVYVGAEVAMGQVIGAVGNTGVSTGPHLHFELKMNGVTVNPLPVLEKFVPTA